MEYLRRHPGLKSRTDTCASILRIKSLMKIAIQEYFAKTGFHEVQVPLITDNECESGANPFTVTTVIDGSDLASVKQKDGQIDFKRDFFNKRTFLTVSGQLHLECLVCGGLSKAWTMTTAFRAEPSTGWRHMAEFWMAELEFCFCDLEDNMTVNEACIKHCFQRILKHCRKI